MKKAQQTRYESLYRKHVNALKRQGKADSTIDLYARAVRRVSEYFDCPPDILNREQLEGYFDALVQTHSWSTIKVERNGLQFFFKHTLKREWQWVEIVKPPQVQSLPDVLTLKEINVSSTVPASCATRPLSLCASAWDCASVKPWPYRWATLMANA